jgi:hypothetical protein
MKELKLTNHDNPPPSRLDPGFGIPSDLDDSEQKGAR